MKRFTVFAAMLAIMLIGTVFFTAVQAEDLYIEMPGEEYTYKTDDLPDSDQLAADFISSVMPSRGRNMLRFRGQRELNLTGATATLYALLLDDITDIANGNRSSTVMEYAFEDVYEQTSFTKDELQVESLVVNGAIAPDAMAAIKEINSYDLGAINSTLLSRCPYEMYWYDKTEGIKTSESYGFSVSGNTITVSGKITFRFTVSSDYSLNGDPYTYNTTYGQSANNAAAKASQIVSDYASASDEGKLRGYASEICTLTSYNDEAAGGGVPYGNPWQLVWVFDENPNTTVVCEGYSKAFQYLCNLTTFSGDIGVITVTGIMRGGTGEGQHMWNLVRLNDGFNYLVDVTNIDEGTIGYPNQLMLAKASSGSVEDGYGFDTDSGTTIIYVYDSGTKSQYTADELTLRDVNDPPYLGLTTILIPDGTQRIESEAFAQTGAEVVIIPEGCEFIADDAFANCENLVYIVNRSTVEIIVPEGVTLITE